MCLAKRAAQYPVRVSGYVSMKGLGYDPYFFSVTFFDGILVVVR